MNRMKLRAPAMHSRGARSRSASAAALPIALLCSGAAFAQPCAPEWDTAIGQPGIDDHVLALTVFDDGTGPALYAGGEFTAAGGQPASRIAKWDGSSWSPLDSGVGGIGGPSVEDLTVFDDGTGPALYAGGIFLTAGEETVNYIARWDGSSWSDVGGGTGGPTGARSFVTALEVFDDGAGEALYVGGRFTMAGGGPASLIARWDGSSWSPLGAGLSEFGSINALTVFDDGTGEALYVTGSFTTAGGQPVSNIATWDGSSWSPLGEGLADTGRAMAVFDDGAGPALYVGGSFAIAGGQAASRIAKWDGSSWSPVGDGISGSNVRALAVFDDGTGEALYAAGNYSGAGGQVASRIAKWDGSSWSPLGSGVSDDVHALAVFDDGAGADLHVAGEFDTAGGAPADIIAAWGCAEAPCYADCDASGGLDFFDFLCFQDLFGAGDPEADCDGSGGLDFFDFLCFQNEFAAGCP